MRQRCGEMIFSIVSPCSAEWVIFRKGATLIPTGGLLHVWMKNSYGPNFLQNALSV